MALFEKKVVESTAVAIPVDTLSRLRQALNITLAELARFDNKLQALVSDIDSGALNAKSKTTYAAKRASIDLEVELKNFRKALP